MASVITITNIGGTPTEYNLYYDKTNQKINTSGPVSSSNFPYEIVVQADNLAWTGNCITIRVESAENSNCSLTKTFCCSTTASGTVFKDEIYNARVFLKENESMTYETANYKTTSDITGSYVLVIPSNITSARIVASGGIDVKTGVQLGESYEFETTVAVEQDAGTVSAEMNIVTTILSKFKKSFPALSQTAALSKLGLGSINPETANPGTEFFKTNAKLNTLASLMSNNSKTNFTKLTEAIATDIAAKVNSNDTTTYNFIADSTVSAGETEVANIVKKATASILSVDEVNISSGDASVVGQLATELMSNIQVAATDDDVIKAVKYVQTGGAGGDLQQNAANTLNPGVDSTNSNISLNSVIVNKDTLISDTQVEQFNPGDPDAITKLSPVAGGSVTTSTTTTTTAAPTTTQGDTTTTEPPTTTQAASQQTQASTQNTTVTTVEYTTTTSPPFTTGTSATTTFLSQTTTANDSVNTTMTTFTSTTVTAVSTTHTSSSYVNYATSTTSAPFIASSTSTTTISDGPPGTTTTTTATIFSVTTTTTTYNTAASSTTTTSSASDVDNAALNQTHVGREVRIIGSWNDFLGDGGHFTITSVVNGTSVTVDDDNGDPVTLNQSGSPERGTEWVLVFERVSDV